MTQKNVESNEITIFKSNALVQDTINNLTVQQNRILCVLMSKYIIGAVKSKEDPEKKGEMINGELSVNEILQLLNITDCKDNYEMVRREMRSFHRNTIIPFENSRFVGSIAFFDKIILDKNTDLVQFKWSESIKPYLCDLSGEYTRIIKSNFMNLRTKRGQIMYEYLKSYLGQGFITASISDLRQRFDANSESYNDFKEFNAKVLKKTLKEVNSTTDVQATMKQIKKGKYTVAITFVIKNNEKNGKQKWGEHKNVYLTYDEYAQIVDELHAKDLVNALSEWKAKGGKCKNDYATIVKWYEERQKNRNPELVPDNEKIKPSDAKPYQSPQPSKKSNKESNRPKPAYESDPLKTNYAQVTDEDIRKYLSDEDRELLIKRLKEDD